MMARYVGLAALAAAALATPSTADALVAVPVGQPYIATATVNGQSATWAVADMTLPSMVALPGDVVTVKFADVDPATATGVRVIVGTRTIAASVSPYRLVFRIPDTGNEDIGPGPEFVMTPAGAQFEYGGVVPIRRPTAPKVKARFSHGALRVTGTCDLAGRTMVVAAGFGHASTGVCTDTGRFSARIPWRRPKAVRVSARYRGAAQPSGAVTVPAR